MHCTVFPVGWTLYPLGFTEEPFSQCFPTALSFFSLDPSKLCYVQIHKGEKNIQKQQVFSMVGITKMSKSLRKSRMMSFLDFYPQKTSMTCCNNAHCPELVQDVHSQTKPHESWASLVLKEFFLLPHLYVLIAEHGLGKWES